MTELVAQIVDLLLLWVLCTTLAQVLHLTAGVVSVGPAEVRRQFVSAIDELGLYYIVFVLSAGFLPRGDFGDD